MLNYKTVEEKAVEWNVSKRHIQYLCKKGDIEGVIKKAGIWFIPDNAPIPVKNTKSNAPQFKFVGTKKKIFDNAVNLFMLYGFENVSIKDIADAVGIRQSALYNHFTSKQEILDTIYDFYCYHHLLNRPSLEDIMPVLEKGSLVDIMKSVCYAFDRKHKAIVSNIINIIFERKSIDKRAKDIAKSLMFEDGIQFIDAVFCKAVEIGRLAPMDTHTMAVFIHSIRIYMLHLWIIDPEINQQAKEDERKLYEHAAKLLTDLKPPAETP